MDDRDSFSFLPTLPNSRCSPSAWANLWSRLQRLGPQYNQATCYQLKRQGEDRKCFLMEHGAG